MGNAKAVIRLIAASNPYLPQPIAPFLGRAVLYPKLRKVPAPI